MSDDQACRVIVTDVESSPSLTWRALLSEPLTDRTVILLVGAHAKFEDVVKAIADRIYESFVRNDNMDVRIDVKVYSLRLEPERPFPENVAALRAAIERIASDSTVCGGTGRVRVRFILVGGSPWLTMVMAYTAFALNTIGTFKGISVEPLKLLINSAEPRGSKCEILHSLPRLADINADEFRILEKVASILKKAESENVKNNKDSRSIPLIKNVAEEIASKLGTSVQTIEAKIRRLKEKELIRTLDVREELKYGRHVKIRGAGRIVQLNDSGVMLVEGPGKTRLRRLY